MKKTILTILMTLVVGVGAFAKPFIVLTDLEAIEYFKDSNYAAQEKAAIKEFFYEELAEEQPKSTWKNFTQIVVYDVRGCVADVWVYTKELRAFGIGVAESAEGPFKDYQCITAEKTDPLLVGISFIGKTVLQIIDVETSEIIFSANEIVKESK